MKLKAFCLITLSLLALSIPSAFSQTQEEDGLLLLMPSIIASTQNKQPPEWGFSPDVFCRRANNTIAPIAYSATIDLVTDRVTVIGNDIDSLPFNGYRKTTPGVKNIRITMQTTPSGIERGCPTLLAIFPVELRSNNRYLLTISDVITVNGQPQPDLRVLSEKITGPASSSTLRQSFIDSLKLSNSNTKTNTPLRGFYSSQH